MDKPPVIPRLAATLLLVRDEPFEVLMVKRHAKAAFASALVFPGGVVEPSDRDEAWLAHQHSADALSDEARSLRIAAIRETFEETSVLLAEQSEACPTIQDGMTFLEYVRALGLVLDLGSLVPFAHWITPALAPKRFDTHFFLACAPTGHNAICDGGETVSLEWAGPSDLVARADAGESAILFPTRANLMRLAQSRNSADALAAARLRPAFTVQPRVERRESGSFVVIPEEAGYGRIEAPLK